MYVSWGHARREAGCFTFGYICGHEIVLLITCAASILSAAKECPGGRPEVLPCSPGNVLRQKRLAAHPTRNADGRLMLRMEGGRRP